MKSNSVTCVFVHGWAMNRAVWDECVSALPDWINVILVDMPGHGSMSDVPADSLDDYVKSLYPLVHRPVMWVGWSLGGLAVLRLAELYPQRVASAILVATNPCFVQQSNWPCAVGQSVFDKFAEDLSHDQDKTIRRFLALQVKGLPDAISTVKKLQKSISAHGQASPHALSTGLDILLETDMRSALASINAPLSWYLGARDGLVPATLSSYLQREHQQGDVVLHEQASHAPFVSHKEDFIKHLISRAEFLRESI